MDNKIELTPYQYASYWWVNRIREFVEDVINIGYSTDEGVEFTQIFDGLKDEHWRILYIKISQLIEEEYRKEGKFIQSTRSPSNDRYLGHKKINEMLKSIICVDIPNVALDPRDKTSLILSISNENVFLSGDNTFSNDTITKMDLKVEKNYILTGDKALLIKTAIK